MDQPTSTAFVREVKEAIRVEMATHVSYIREDIQGVRDDIALIQREGCAVGVQNKQRLDDIDKRTGFIGASAAAIVSAGIAVANWVTGQ